MLLYTGSGSARKLVTGILLSSFTVGILNAGLEAQAVSSIVMLPDSSPEKASQTSPSPVAGSLKSPVEKGHPEQTLLAHHESGGVGVSSLLTAGASSHGKGSLSKSLWTNMILSMAYQQDAELQAIDKKLHRFGAIAFGSIAAISGLALAQGINGFVTLQDEPHPLHPPIMGLIGSGLTLLTIGSQAVMGHRYKKQLEERQHEIQHDVVDILSRLKTDGATELVQANLSRLIGDEAKDEFIELWTAVHH